MFWYYICMAPTDLYLRQTESISPRAPGLDALSPLAALSALHEGQVIAARVVESAFEAISQASSRAADCLAAGGKLAYVGAGSSGLLAVADGLELPGTFGLECARIALILAGGLDGHISLNSASEDDTETAAESVRSAGLGEGDCAVFVSASGHTPFTVAGLAAASEAGVVTIALANNADAPLLQQADVAIYLPTPPEVLAGSTRMGAGTAQKIALNMFSTLIGIHLGHVHDGLMVNVVADNEKLKQRAVDIICRVAGCPPPLARDCIRQTDGAVKPAILLAKGARSLEDANRVLTENGGKLRNCFEALANPPG